MSRSMRRRDFLIAAAAAGTACLAAPSVRAFGRLQAATPDPDFHVYLAFGQSNMEGFPGIEARDQEAVDPRFRMLAAVDFAELGRRRTGAERGNDHTILPQFFVQCLAE